jgi:short-subunit dehydrogenase
MGIGKEIVRRFTERNFPETSGTHKVILACRSVESGEETAKELRATMRYSNIELSVLPLDISKGKSIDSFAACQHISKNNTVSSCGEGSRINPQR